MLSISSLADDFGVCFGPVPLSNLPEPHLKLSFMCLLQLMSHMLSMCHDYCFGII